MTDEIRRQFGAPASMRFLRSLPTLQVDQDLPDAFHGLLAELDRVEARKAGRQ